ncbi:uncharacterized protein LOC117104940 [Anneissia japonica]|uniref:uncharacterized protein LOC117104940 n=1 Tax=Anneissia japonica TaxID=1529436 RepID=UPI0014258794|nr:uncharacterized protein LOC117104940 [Anneissia japonica]
MADFLKKVFPNVVKIDNSNDLKCSAAQIDDAKEVFGINNVNASDRCLIIGETESGQSALLFQCALSCALEGANVTFITPNKLETMPLLIEGARQPDHEVMKQVHIMYLHDRLSLLKYLSSIHTNSSLPHVILVDKLDYYSNQPKAADKIQIVSETCAYLLDAISFVQSKMNAERLPHTNIKCMLGASVCTSGPLDSPLLDLYQHFIPTIFQISVVSRQKSVFQIAMIENDQKKSHVINYIIGTDTIKICEDKHLQAGKNEHPVVH